MLMALNDKRQVKKNRTFLLSLGHSLDGLVTVFKEERNMKKHVAMMILVSICAAIFQISETEWLWLALSISMVIINEVWNTVIENLVDLTTGHKYNEIAKKVKDMSAAAVLLSALFAMIVGCLIFIPQLLELVFD
ncbi:diacylglycerol kinase family protein [Dellaglioa sp. P0083]|uniref:diacylglycerol kinase family protein n=1 Tax=Dellaglioa kimchii TaxID=3344667 RepID=UPI0038D43269